MRILSAVPAVLIALAAVPARAQLVITPAGAADGFSISTFATGFAFNGLGPLGSSINSLGQVIVNSSADSSNYVFNDVDGQTVAGAVSHTAFSAFPPAMTLADGSVWTSGGFTGPNAGHFIKLNADGSINTVYSNSSGTTSGLDPTNGMWTDPVNGHVIATGSSEIYDIDVSGATPTFRVITGASPDGLTVSADGSTVYGAVGGGIEGWNIATGAVVFAFLGLDGGSDGMGIISGGSLNGDIVVNSNNGILELVNPTTRAVTVIANGGTRGDYTSADTTNGTLFLSQNSIVQRLSCGSGCSIGGPPPGVPEPSSIILYGTVALLAAWRFRKQTVKS